MHTRIVGATARLSIVGMICGAILAGMALIATEATAAAPEASAGTEVQVLQVRPDIYMLTVAGINIAVQTGPDGTIVVGSGPKQSGAAVLEKIKQITRTPIRYVINTSANMDLIGGNGPLVASGRSIIPQPDLPFNNNQGGFTDARVGVYAAVVAHENTLTHQIEQGGFDPWELPSETFGRPNYQFYMNGQAITVIHQPSAHSDGDCVVRFEGSDVVVTGAVFDMTRFPVIDTARGGTAVGELNAVNDLLNNHVFTSTPIVRNDIGTLVIPVRGPLSNQADVLTYRDMIATVQKRMRHLIGEGKDLKQILAAEPTQGYDTRFGAAGEHASREFVEALYRTMASNKKSARRSAP